MESLKTAVYGLLRRSERLFKLDMIYVAKGSFWNTASFVISTTAALVSMIAFGNLLSRENYGTYNYLLSLGASLSFLTLSGIGPAVMRLVARGYESIVPKALNMVLKWNSVAAALIISVAIYYGYKGNMLFAVSLAFLALAYPVAEAFHISKDVLIGKRRFDLLAKISAISTILSTAVTVILLFLTDNVLVLVGAYALTSLIINYLSYGYVAQGLDHSPIEPQLIDEVKRSAVHFTGSGAIGAIASYIDKIVLFQAAGPAALAIYGFAIAGPERLKSLLKSWLSIALPKLAESSLSGIRAIVYKRIGLSMLAGSVLFLVYVTFAPFLFELFLPRYLDSIRYSQVIAAGLILSPITIYIGSALSSQNMLRAMYAYNFGNHVLRIVLFVTLGWLWKIWGLIIASLIYQAVNSMYSIIVWEYESKRLIKKNNETS